MTDAEANEAIHKIWIERFGACPHYKGHFDGHSFMYGMLLGASLTGMVMVIANAIIGKT